VPLLILPALFEEMNRTRRLLTLTCAALAQEGVRTWLPDLPGTGDHAEQSTAADVPRWREAVEALAHVAGGGRAVHLLAVRGGALLAEPGAASLYRLAPQASGAKLLRDLWRTRAAAESEAGSGITAAAIEARSLGGETIVAAGYPITPTLAAQLRGTTSPALPIPTRTAATAPGESVDIVLPGAPVWRQAEPTDMAVLANALAIDVHAWLRVQADPA